MSWLVVVSVAAYVLIAVAGIVAARVISRQTTRAGRRPDGSWEEGRRVRDMTLVGKVALVTTFASFLAVAVLGATDSGPWLLVCMAVGLGATLVALVSERRRLRRAGIEPRPSAGPTA